MSIPEEHDDTESPTHAIAVRAPLRMEVEAAEDIGTTAYEGKPLQVEFEMQWSGGGTSLLDNGDDGSTDSDDSMLEGAGSALATARHEMDMQNDGIRTLEADPISWRNVALPFHYLATGYITTVCIGVLYGVLMGVMAVDTNVYWTSQAAILSPWGTKCIFGILSDQFPLLGYAAGTIARWATWWWWWPARACSQCSPNRFPSIASAGVKRKCTMSPPCVMRMPPITRMCLSFC